MSPGAEDANEVLKCVLEGLRRMREFDPPLLRRAGMSARLEGEKPNRRIVAVVRDIETGEETERWYPLDPWERYSDGEPWPPDLLASVISTNLLEP